jgi:anti-anti-sigma factor
MHNQLTMNTNEHSLIVTIPPEFDGYAVDQHRDALHRLVESEYQDICLNFESTHFIDSSGIGVIVFLFKRLTNAEKQLSLINVAGQPQKLMSMLHVDRCICINPDNMSLAV